MLHAGYIGDHQPTPQPGPPSSPIRRLTQPALPSYPTVEDATDAGAEFISSSPAPHEGARIRRDAFSPNYFKRFFVEERELGRGGKGVVLLVRHEIDGCTLGHFACKRVPVGDDHAWLEKVLVEVELLAKLSHPNLVSYRHVWLEDVQIHRFGPSVASAFILQQYCNSGDLLRFVIGDQPAEVSKEQLKAQIRRRSKQGERPQDVIPSQRRLTLEEIYSLFKDITSGLAYLHGANYIHRDLKPSNCLLHREGNKLTCLISDFGEVQPENAIRKSTGTTGTISYCAPEVLKVDASGRFGNFTTKSDVFSLGMILFFLCFGRLPYQNANVIQEELEDIDLLRAEISGWRGFQDESRRERADLPSKLYQLLKRMLALNPVDRPSAVEVLSVMNHESTAHSVGVGGLGVRGRSSSPSSPVGLRHRKIHSLDSPATPSTPVQDPVKQYQHGASSTTGVGLPTSPISDSADDITVTDFQDHSLETSLQKHQHQPPTMTLTSSQDSYVSRSPITSSNAHYHHDQPPSTPLLMPPPSLLRQRQHPIIQFIQGSGDSLSLIFRLGLFVVKMTSLFRPCFPYVPTVSVLIPLVSLAALDLGMMSPDHGLALRRQSPGVMGSGVQRGWKASLIALFLHFLVITVVERWGVFCTVRRGDWMDNNW